MPKKKQLNCGICGLEKRSMFLKSGKEKLVCDKCRKEKSSLWQKENKERVNEKNRIWSENNYEKKYSNSKNSKLLKEYGITLEEYNKMSDAQNHCCKICEKQETKMLGKTKWKLSVDHCHATGKIRGLLCAKCNVGLAKFEENEQHFLNAIKYLKGEL